MNTEENKSEEKKTLSFVEQLVEKDLADGKNGGGGQTPFPPGAQRLSAYRSCKGYLHGFRRCRELWWNMQLTF